MPQNRSRHAMSWAAMLAAVVIIAAACGESGTESLEQNAWELTELGDTELAAGAPAGIVFGSLDEGTGPVAGSTGCNSFNGQYEVDGEAIGFGPLATTLTACADPAAQTQEQQYLAALEAAATYSISGNTLELANAEGETTARFARANTSLELTSWKAISINNGTGGVQSVVQGTEVTATFGDDEMVAGSGGCNTYSAAYRTGDEYDVFEGAAIEFDTIAATKKACQDDVGTQEDQYFAALERSGRYVFRVPNLELRSSDGALQVLYAPASEG